MTEGTAGHTAEFGWVCNRPLQKKQKKTKQNTPFCSHRVNLAGLNKRRLAGLSPNNCAHVKYWLTVEYWTKGYLFFGPTYWLKKTKKKQNSRCWENDRWGHQSNKSLTRTRVQQVLINKHKYINKHFFCFFLFFFLRHYYSSGAAINTTAQQPQSWHILLFIPLLFKVAVLRWTSHRQKHIPLIC